MQNNDDHAILHKSRYGRRATYAFDECKSIDVAEVLMPHT